MYEYFVDRISRFSFVFVCDSFIIYGFNQFYYNNQINKSKGFFILCFISCYILLHVIQSAYNWSAIMILSSHLQSYFYYGTRIFHTSYLNSQVQCTTESSQHLTKLYRVTQWEPRALWLLVEEQRNTENKGMFTRKNITDWVSICSHVILLTNLWIYFWPELILFHNVVCDNDSWKQCLFIKYFTVISRQ